jgi:hypothetical protein
VDPSSKAESDAGSVSKKAKSEEKESKDKKEDVDDE